MIRLWNFSQAAHGATFSMAHLETSSTQLHMNSTGLPHTTSICKSECESVRAQ